MAVFFMMVGLEIKRELVTGQLATWSQRALALPHWVVWPYLP
jgi:NhaA family Na+:H+ antiporter